MPSDEQPVDSSQLVYVVSFGPDVLISRTYNITSTMFHVEHSAQLFWGSQPRRTSSSASPIATRSSGMAIAKSGTPRLFTSPTRALYPAKVPITAPTAPSSAPTMRDAPPATARHAPVSAPITMRAVSGPAVVRAGVFGS